MRYTRRGFLGALLATRALRTVTAGPLAGLKIGVTDWNLRLAADPKALELGAQLGFEGVEVSLGREPVDGRLKLDDAALQAQYLAESKRLGVAIAGTCLDILHRNYLKNDPLGAKWVAAGIPITQRLGARVMLLPFFGKGALQTPQEMDYVADVLKDLAKEAEKAGVILGLENTLSAEDNARILDRVGSPAVKVYYDVGNSTTNGYDIYKEIPWLGAERICQFHLKDNPHYLGEGKIDFERVLRLIGQIGYRGFANLETNSPSKDIPADMRRNLAYIRQLIARLESRAA